MPGDFNPNASFGGYIGRGTANATDILIGVVNALTNQFAASRLNYNEQDAFTLGYIIYFFEIAIALSGYLNAINPFDQPGVEAYKKNMFALLGKPGFEELGAELNARL